MLANPTTLILGAGASHHLGYPTGSKLREWIIEGRGMGVIEEPQEKSLLKHLQNQFRTSLVSSIDAFLAEPEYKDFENIGKLCIAAALLPCESGQAGKSPGWYQSIFNAIRGRRTAERTHPVRIVTFNYDLSLEHALFYAFKSTYKLTHSEALSMLNESVEFIHVYGTLGQITELDGANGRRFGQPESEDYQFASTGIKIIGRDPDAKGFKSAQDAIASAEFLAILGFGYDQTNVANLKLKELVGPKHVFSTGFDMGYGMRGWIRSKGLPSISIGALNHDVSSFLHHSAFLHWANTPGATSDGMRDAISNYFKCKHRLPD